jgi:hypothetical protein
LVVDRHVVVVEVGGEQCHRGGDGLPTGIVYEELQEAGNGPGVGDRSESGGNLVEVHRVTDEQHGARQDRCQDAEIGTLRRAEPDSPGWP